MSELRELTEELKDRLQAWRRKRSAQDAPVQEEHADVSGVEFTPLAPFQAPDIALRRWSEITPAWVTARCAPETLAQARQYVRAGRVTRVHALGARLTGTTQADRFLDQEITLREDGPRAVCSCQTAPGQASPSTSTNANRALDSPFPCAHTVAVLLAHLQSAAIADARPSAPRLSASLVCPVTRQTLRPDRPLWQCASCGTCFSAEGWEFLRQTERGRCCGCGGRDTIKAAGNGL